MMISRKVLLPALLVIGGLGASAVFGVNYVEAQARTGHMSGLVAVIASKFGLDQARVQTVIDDYEKTSFSERETQRLSSLVTEGKITEAQKKLILAEMETLRAKYDPQKDKNLTSDQRKTQMDARRAELDAWAKTNNIDVQYLMMGRGFGPGRGMWKQDVRN